MDSRTHYVDVLQDISVNGISFTDVKNDISDENRAFFNMLLMSCFRNMAFIKQEILPQFIRKKIPHKQKVLEFIFYLAVTELCFLDTPDYAVVNSYTEIAKKKTDKFGANFVNAVLRKIAQQKEQLLKKRKIKYFGPDFIKILKQDYTLSQIREMEEFAGIEPSLDLTVKQQAVLNFDGAVKLPWGNIRMPANTKINTLPYFNDGLYWAQDAASALPVKCLKDTKGKDVLDLCAAPGGKTAQLLSAGAKVTAVDISEKRLQRLKENMTRLNLTKNLDIICSDALCFESSKQFDIVLLDAPCSATGTFRRHPEIMNTKTIGDVKKMANLQQKILERAGLFLRPGGTLVYATCSLAKEEGEKQIGHFIKAHPEYKILPINLNDTEDMRTKEGYLRVFPQHLKNFGGIDGFFVAVLQRNF